MWWLYWAACFCYHLNFFRIQFQWSFLKYKYDYKLTVIIVHASYYGAQKLLSLVYFYRCLLPAANVHRRICSSTWAKLMHVCCRLGIFCKISLYYLFQNLICSECGDEFTLQSQLSIHMEEHRQELAGNRIHSCKSCKKEFETSSQLKEHMKTHYKIRWQSWDCNKMSRCYFYSDSLEKQE